MFNDSQISKWIEKHGTATSFTFIVYGDLKEHEVELLIKGLVIHLEYRNILHNMAVFFDPINEEQAVAWNTFQGTSLSFVFAGDMTEIENEIEMIIKDGLKYMKYKNDYLGFYRSDSHV